LKFGSEGIEISPVPPGDLTTTRPGVAHYHVGIDQDCLAPGKTIVKGTPSWVHFGDGKDVIRHAADAGKAQARAAARRRFAQHAAGHLSGYYRNRQVGFIFVAHTG
jgi:hypothetical protein